MSIIAAGAAVRHLGLSAESLWIDEGWRAYLASGTFPEATLRSLTEDVHLEAALGELPDSFWFAFRTCDAKDVETARRAEALRLSGSAARADGAPRPRSGG